MSITSSSVLVEMNISVWLATKLDRAATDAVTSINHAGKNAARVKKNLMAGTVLQKNIADYAAACRHWHNKRTLPWADRGPRLLPTSWFMDYKTEVNLRRATFFGFVDTFILEYPNLVGIAQHNAEGLGTLFNKDDYPNADAVRDLFGFRLVFSPVPDSGDFRLDVPAQELEEMRREYDINFEERVAEAMREPWDRLHKTLTHMSERLTDVDGAEKRYHETLVTNAQGLCEMLTHLNITKDPKLEEARRSLEATMMGADIEVLKESPESRETMKRNVDAILEKFEW
jgi:hypothetical protein